MAERLGEVVSGAWLGWCEGGRTEKFVDDRDWSAVKRQCMEGGEVVVEVEAQEQSKLGVMQRLLVHGSKDRCVDVKCKRLRRLLAMQRGGTAAQRVETGR